MSQTKEFEICENVARALRDCRAGSTIMVGGFGLAGIPENTIEYVRTRPDMKDFTIISTEAGDDNWGLGTLIKQKKIRKQYASYIGRCKVFEQAYLKGQMELELIPQGTLAEKIRCAGAGIPAFYTITGKDTLYAEGKLPKKFDPSGNGQVLSYNSKRETRKFGHKEYLLEEAFPTADFAWIKAWKADKMGNCIFKGTGFNFNRIMANAARCTIVECEELVETGELKPEQIHLPGLNVNRIFKGEKFENRIEVLKFSDEKKSDLECGPETSVRDVIAQRAALEFVPGMQCNLGVGMPTLAASYADRFGRNVFMQSENGMIGVGGYPKKGEEQADWINAGKEAILPTLGASTFGSDVSFAQIRGGHLDMTVLGALECSQYGDVANYMIPGKMVKGMGGAMDLVSNPERTKVLIVQTHVDKYGEPKIKKQCDLPLTGAKCVRTIVTNLACFDVDHERGLTLRDYNPLSSIDEIREKTEADFRIGKECKPWEIPSML